MSFFQYAAEQSENPERFRRKARARWAVGFVADRRIAAFPHFRERMFQGAWLERALELALDHYNPGEDYLIIIADFGHPYENEVLNLHIGRISYNPPTIDSILAFLVTQPLRVRRDM